MPLSVNEEIVPEELIQLEMERLVKLTGFQSIPNETEREARVREMAEIASADRVILRQIADNDHRPLEPFATVVERAALAYRER